MCSCDRTPLHISIFSPVRTEAVCVKLSQEGLGTVITLLGGETFPGSGQNVTVARCSINNKNITNDSNNKKALWVCTTHRLVWCVHVCMCSLSPFLFSLHSDGSNVCFFYTWPCLFGRTYQRRLVGASLPLPAYLSGPVQSGQMPADSFLFSFFFFFLLFSLSFFQSFLFS